jgi:hypothetical protein
MVPTTVSVFEPRLEGTDLVLEAVHASLEVGELGPEVRAVESLFDTVQALFDALQTGDQHVVLGTQVLDLLGEGVEQTVNLVAKPLLRGADHALDVRSDDFTVEFGEDLNEVFHAADRTPSSAEACPPTERAASSLDPASHAEPCAALLSLPQYLRRIDP